MRTALYLLNVGGDYAPSITALTYPLIYGYARKIDAEVVEIRERRFPGWPITYEKLQIHNLARRNGAEWHYYLDSDALIHPDTPDWTQFISPDTVAHNGIDFANVRWRYDDYFRRDGRNIGSCNWNTIAHRQCIDLWHPLDDLSPDEAVAAISPTVDEARNGITAEHLIDDYALSRNIARFGLKVQTLIALEKRLGFDSPGFYHHQYTLTVEGKVLDLKTQLHRWGISYEGYDEDCAAGLFKEKVCPATT